MKKTTSRLVLALGAATAVATGAVVFSLMGIEGGGKASAPPTVTETTNDVTPGSENLLSSSNIAEGGWWNQHITFTPNIRAAADGSMTAARIVSTSEASFNFRFTHNIDLSPGTYSFYVDVEYDNSQWIAVRAVEGGTFFATFIDVQNGLKGTEGSGNSTTVTSMGGGIYRVKLTRTFTNGKDVSFAIGAVNANGSVVVSADKGVYASRTILTAP